MVVEHEKERVRNQLMRVEMRVSHIAVEAPDDTRGIPGPRDEVLTSTILV